MENIFGRQMVAKQTTNGKKFLDTILDTISIMEQQQKVKQKQIL